MKGLYIIAVTIFFSCSIFSQGELDESSKIFYRNEKTYGILLNSNGLGFNYRYAKRIDAYRKTLYEAEINYLKHPKENRVTLQVTNRSIIYGKLNSTYTLKGSIGIQKELYQKRDMGGISIRYFANIGPSLAIMKPVYFEYYDFNIGDYYYDKFLEHGNYVGRGPFTMGISEISVSPGLYGKFGFTFEYSKVDELFHAIEAGAGFDAYARKLRIMDTQPEKILFILPDDYFVLSLFISYRFGKVLSSQFTPQRNRIDNLIVD
ncbi:MAG: hypothetical protein JXA77_04215 [Bacteroidales bacterium]|nr:hypothetical protein [Bacteroidales bacterium]MBN2818244.1 hypothetical protein [Bacteroidales bacterium]